MVATVVHSAGIQDRDAAPRVMKQIRRSYPWLRHVFADGGYAGPKLRKALAGMGKWNIDIVKPSEYRERLRGLAPQMGRRADIRLARSLPPPRKGLGENHRERHCMADRRPHPHRYATARKILLNGPKL